MNKKLLAALIALSGLPDADIAAKLGISLSTYYKKKRGESEYTRAEIAAFAELLDSEEAKRLLDDLRGINSAKDVFFWDERCQ